MNNTTETSEPDRFINILKSRDDPEPVYFEKSDDTSFRLIPDRKCTWLKQKDLFGPDKLRPRIEPWLTALFQSEHLSLLVGSGVTHAIHKIATDDNLSFMSEMTFSEFQSQIISAAKLSAKKAGREHANFEDQIRVANELLIGLEIYCHTNGTSDEWQKFIERINSLRTDISIALKKFVSSILKAETDIVSTSDQKKKERAFGCLVNFLMSFASRTGTRDRLQIFTTNYDRLLEVGAEVAGMHLIDRFVGNITPIFRSSRLNIDMHYNPPGIRGEPRYLEGVARFTKLHGSIDWIYANGDIRRIGLPFGAASIDPYLKAPGLACNNALDMMIFPNSAKDRETTEYPYVELFRDFAAAVCRPNSTLVTYGYSFGDEHINRVIQDMLTIPSSHLVVISYDDPMGRIMKIYKKVSREAQITLLIGNHLGDLQTLVDYYLPKPAIDRTTIRMAELLKSRFDGEPTEKNKIIEETAGDEQ